MFQVNKTRPFGIQENCTLLVDLSALSNPGDIKSDGNGAWEHGTYPSTTVIISDCGITTSRTRPTDEKLVKLGKSFHKPSYYVS